MSLGTRTAALTVVAAALSGPAAIVLATPAWAAPQCTDVGANTRVCARGPGHTAITTSPDPAFTNPGAGWGFGTLGIPVFGIGGGGFWIGF